MDDAGTGGTGRPLTRRELRALEAGRTEDAGGVEGGFGDLGEVGADWRMTVPGPEAEAWAGEEPEAEAWADAEPEAEAWAGAEPEAEVPSDESEPDAVDVAWPVAGSTLAETTWSDDVRWSLHGELPRELPPEPEVDDVRWESEVADTVPAPPPRTSWRQDWAEPARAADQGVEQGPGVEQGEETWPVEETWAGEVTAEAWHADVSQAVDEAQVPTAPTRVSAWQVAVEEPAGSPLPPLDVVQPVAGFEQPDAGGEQAVLEQGESAWRQGAVDQGAVDQDGADRDQDDQGAQADAWQGVPGEVWPGEEAEEVWPGEEAEAGLLPAAPPPPPAPAEPEPLPTLSDLLAARPAPPDGPAEHGWRGNLRRFTGGLLAMRPGPAEQRHRAAVASVQRTLDGPRTIVVINPKGGAHKTTAALLLAATFGQHRGGYTLAWDNNETRGTLGWRAAQAGHHRTAVDLLRDLDRFSDPGHARVGDLDNYVRSQGAAQFDVLASDEDAASAGSINDFAFNALHRTLARFYRVMVIDTGNNMRASNWQAAIEAADQVVIVSTVREDTAQSAAWAIDAMRANGYEDVVRRAVTVLSDPAPRRDAELSARLHDHFGRLTRAVIDVPHDRSLVGGTPLEWDRLDRRTREAWLTVAAAVADGL